MDTTILITDPDHKYYNQRLKGYCYYYDYQFTGNSPDLYSATTPEGKTIRLLSLQIDTKDYENQLIEEKRKKLNAKEGDTVLITHIGSGTYTNNFRSYNQYKIDKITPSGHVDFVDDKGIFVATIFRPIVEVVDFPF
ncbi:hypothetical protein G6N05_05315 [Flavobacterium sp. F372]|uniref:Uncharacterized protein n=1 Tax=Flavobacterium bernardetii TaxID=2813823 RepID=A0ABR7J178_9FLAO|nr:hypothetical protein [Flavobacterium bernardetii]MBC5835799.1 hypothetical protein [Flavobacterium bernardetii]NHF69530.1 hypothetical protein [Flavobacterium bernardetii]